MILLIDIGNSRTKFVELKEGQFSKTTQLSNQTFNTDYFDDNFSCASKVVLANVAHANLTKQLKNWCDENTIAFTQVHSELQKNALTSAYQEPTTLGIDRWLALLGATRLYPKQNVLIIDAGTATTVDFVDNLGQHQGGWILAGIQALFDSILANSTLVFAKEKAQASVSFGKNTTDNVNNACWAATLGMVKQAISQAQQLGELEQIIFTGGNGSALADLLSSEYNDLVTKNIVIDNLIFYGLQEYCE